MCIVGVSGSQRGDNQDGDHGSGDSHDGALNTIGSAHQGPDNGHRTAHNDTGHAAGGGHLLGEEGEQDGGGRPPQ